MEIVCGGREERPSSASSSSSMHFPSLWTFIFAIQQHPTSFSKEKVKARKSCLRVSKFINFTSSSCEEKKSFFLHDMPNILAYVVVYYNSPSCCANSGVKKPSQKRTLVPCKTCTAKWAAASNLCSQGKKVECSFQFGINRKTKPQLLLSVWVSLISACRMRS